MTIKSESYGKRECYSRQVARYEQRNGGGRRRGGGRARWQEITLLVNSGGPQAHKGKLEPSD